MERKKICFVVAVPGSANAFLKDHIKALKKDYDVYLAGNITDESQVSELDLCGWHHVDIIRNISFFSDLKAINQLIKYFKSNNFDAVHSLTPKAGLLCAVASKIAGIKHRIHVYTGQVWATRTGFMRFLLKQLDKTIALLDNHILVDGEPQRQFLITNNVIKDSNSAVLGKGSISGVNTSRFTPSIETRKKIRKELNLTDDSFIFCFMGRQNIEKGIYELYAAFNKLLSNFPNAVLLLYGFDEGHCMSHLSEYENIKENENFIFYGVTREPQKYIQASDVFCMPSYREGFGTSVIEASCLGIPVICSDIYGLQDTMVDNVTGLRCKVKDEESLFKAMLKYIQNPKMAKEHGINGRKRVLKYFAGEEITRCWVNWYNNILKD